MSTQKATAHRPCAWTPSGSIVRDMIHYRTCPHKQCQLRGTAIAMMLRVIPSRCTCPNCVSIRRVMQ